METLTHWIAQITKLSPWVQTNLFTSIIIILILWLLQTLVMSIVVRRVEDVRLRYRWRKTSKSVAAALGVVLVGRVWFEGIQSLATFLGLVAAGLTIVLKDVVTAIAGWFFIIWRRPFNVGDRIQIGQHAGDVIDVRIF
jgi:small-conductance mechanosensitive channel